MTSPLSHLMNDVARKTIMFQSNSNVNVTVTQYYLGPLQILTQSIDDPI